ncbi:unnamed protein product [Microthlaspi erraticum]|uniref:Strictosidine synthase conserved region domain-containing protein n=1 Tax=Microthlaspi erraticum TaxID=1685480 RepID=A0A6D2HGR9_9BRAS|nr:unnamed protein product [Microthlaspi erraticum]
MVRSTQRWFVLNSCDVPTQLVHRYWAKEPKYGTRNIFAKLPSYANDIRRTETGDLWVALHSKKTPFLGGKPHAVAVKLCGETSEVLEILEDSERKNMKFVSEVQERYRKLWFGCVFLPSVWVLDCW